jgi:hypothetical protein
MERSSGGEFICGRAPDKFAASGTYLHARDYIVRQSIRLRGEAGRTKEKPNISESEIFMAGACPQMPKNKALNMKSRMWGAKIAEWKNQRNYWADEESKNPETI